MVVELAEPPEGSFDCDSGGLGPLVLPDESWAGSSVRVNVGHLTIQTPAGTYSTVMAIRKGAAVDMLDL